MSKEPAPERKATNITWHQGNVTREDREQINRHRGATLWFTGLSGSGKSTVAVALEKALWDEVERTMSDYFAYPGVRQWWATRKHWLTDEFRAVVEAIIAKNPEQKLYAVYNLDESSKA